MALKKKKRQPSLTTLRDKLDGLVSRYVRLKAADHRGIAHCVSCGKADHWQNMDAGHFVSRQATAVRFDLRNIHPQCRRCNRFSSDHLIGYTIWMQEKYGDAVIAELWARKHEPVKYTRGDYETMIDDMATKLAKLVSGERADELPEATRWALENVS